MDASKLQFLQSVLRFSTANTDGTEKNENMESQPSKREMSPEVINSFEISNFFFCDRCLKYFQIPKEKKMARRSPVKHDNKSS